MDNQELSELRESIHSAFPAEPYQGRVTLHDEGPWTEDLDEEQALFEHLKGRRWTEIPVELLQQLPDGYVMLTSTAFADFLPAWLVQSLEGIGHENTIREFLIYVYERDGAMDYLSPLNTTQRSVVRALMAEFARLESNEFVRKAAQNAVLHIDELLGRSHRSI